MASSYTIGRFAGVDLKVHVTFFLLLLYFGFQGWSYGGPVGAAMSVAFISAVFVCVVLHEFGHVLMAKHFGIRTRDVVLLPIGGVARLEYFPTKPKQELLIALAGPAVTLGIAVLLYAVLTLQRGHAPSIVSFTTLGNSFLFNILVVNAYLLFFNLIPAFPMDGGRVLRAMLSNRVGLLRGTRIAATVGKGFAIAFGMYAIFDGVWENSFLLLIAAFVFLAANGELAAVEARARLEPRPPDAR